jgi:hypothetical protein
MPLLGLEAWEYLLNAHNPRTQLDLDLDIPRLAQGVCDDLGLGANDELPPAVRRLLDLTEIQKIAVAEVIERFWGAQDTTAQPATIVGDLLGLPEDVVLAGDDDALQVAVAQGFTVATRAYDDGIGNRAIDLQRPWPNGPITLTLRASTGRRDLGVVLPQALSAHPRIREREVLDHVMDAHRDALAEHLGVSA